MKKKEITVATTESVAKKPSKKVSSKKITNTQTVEPKKQPVFVITVDLVNNDNIYEAIVEAKETANVNPLIPAWFEVTDAELNMIANIELERFNNNCKKQKKQSWFKRCINYIKSLWK